MGAGVIENAWAIVALAALAGFIIGGVMGLVLAARLAWFDHDTRPRDGSPDWWV